MLTWYLMKLFQWLEGLLGVNQDWVEWYFALTYQFWFKTIPNFMIKIKEVDQFWFRHREQWLSKQLELFNDCIMRNIGTTIVSWKHIWQKELVHVTYKNELEGELQLSIESQHMTIQIGVKPLFHFQKSSHFLNLWEVENNIVRGTGRRWDAPLLVPRALMLMSFAHLVN